MPPGAHTILKFEHACENKNVDNPNAERTILNFKHACKHENVDISLAEITTPRFDYMCKIGHVNMCWRKAREDLSTPAEMKISRFTKLAIPTATDNCRSEHFNSHKVTCAHEIRTRV